jgi:hypothetical protein
MKNAILGSVALASTAGLLLLQAGSAQALTFTEGSVFGFNTGYTNFNPNTGTTIPTFINSTSNIASGINSTGGFVVFDTPSGAETAGYNIIDFDLTSLVGQQLLSINNGSDSFTFTVTGFRPESTVVTSVGFFYALFEGELESGPNTGPGELVLSGTIIDQSGGTLNGTLRVGTNAIPEPFTILGAATAAAFGAAYKRKLANKK